MADASLQEKKNPDLTLPFLSESVDISFEGYVPPNKLHKTKSQLKKEIRLIQNGNQNTYTGAYNQNRESLVVYLLVIDCVFHGVCLMYSICMK